MALLLFVTRRFVVSFSNRWVSFDCFGTLVDWHAWFAEVLGPLGSHTSTDVIRAYHAHERLVERDYPHRSYKDVLVTALGRAATDCGIHLSSQDARNILMAGWASMRLFDDVEVMLAELRANGYRLAVLTNCDEDLFWTTHRLFTEPFDFVLTAERVQGYKPERWHFSGFERLTRSQQVELGARGQQLVPRHRTGAGARCEARVARSRQDAVRDPMGSRSTSLRQASPQRDRVLAGRRWRSRTASWRLRPPHTTLTARSPMSQRIG